MVQSTIHLLQTSLLIGWASLLESGPNSTRQNTAKGAYTADTYPDLQELMLNFRGGKIIDWQNEIGNQQILCGIKANKEKKNGGSLGQSPSLSQQP